MCVCVCYVHAMTHLWNLGDNLWDWVLSFHCVTSKNQSSKNQSQVSALVASTLPQWTISPDLAELQSGWWKQRKWLLHTNNITFIVETLGFDLWLNLKVIIKYHRLTKIHWFLTVLEARKFKIKVGIHLVLTASPVPGSQTLVLLLKEAL